MKYTVRIHDVGGDQTVKSEFTELDEAVEFVGRYTAPALLDDKVYRTNVDSIIITREA